MEKKWEVWGIRSHIHDVYPKTLVFLEAMLESCGIAALDDDTVMHG